MYVSEDMVGQQGRCEERSGRRFWGMEYLVRGEVLRFVDDEVGAMK